MPRMAAIAPVPTGTASCMACARKRTSGAACASVNTPDATSAEYSPSECPATARRQRAAFSTPDAPRSYARHQHHRLGVGGQRERLFGAILDQRADVLAQRVGSLPKRRQNGRMVAPGVEHAHGLRALTRKYKCKWLHLQSPYRVKTAASAMVLDLSYYKFSSTAPQVKPPPTPSSSSVCPGLTWPVRTPWSSASGIDAADVLPCWSTVTTSLDSGSLSLLRRAGHDADVGLVRDQPVDVGVLQPGLGQRARAVSSSTPTASLKTA